MKLTSASVLMACILAFTACKKEKESVLPEGGTTGTNTSATGKGSFDMYFHNVVKDRPLDLGNVWYVTDDGDTYRVTYFSYYISNIAFNAADGSRYAEPESYHLVEANDLSSLNFTVNNVPPGNYNSVSFTIGVDFYKNISTEEQSGALDTANGMHMGPGKGYTMAKLEGFAPRAGNGKLKYHIGGYDGPNNTIKNVTLQFKQPMSIGGNNLPLNIKANVAKWFDAVHPVDFATMSTVDTLGPAAKMMADNYANMFTIDESALKIN